MPICTGNAHHRCNITKQRSNSVSQGCHCDVACKYFNDCCYEYSQLGVYKEDQLKELHMTFESRGIERPDWRCHGKGDKGYWSVSRCDKDLGVITDKCHYPICNDTLSFVPVTDPEGITYRNVYCAVCHGVEVSSLMAWKVEADCGPDFRQHLQGSNTTVPDASIVCNECKLTSRVPKTFLKSPITSRKCVPDVVSMCDRITDHTEAQRSCDAYTAIVNVGGTIYRNPHCFMCNSNETTLQNYTLTCDDGDIPRLLPKFKISTHTMRGSPLERKGKNLLGPSSTRGSYSNFAGVPLSIILDFGSGESSSVRVYYQKEIIQETKMSCPSGKVYVELPGGGECLTVHCPDGTTLINGDCVLPSPAYSLTVGNETTWCGNYSESSVRLTATVTSPDGNICNNKSLINLYSNCLCDAVQIEHRIANCMQIERNRTELSVQINSTDEVFNKIYHIRDKLNVVSYPGVSTDNHLCGLNSIEITQTCLDQNTGYSCPSDWISPENISLKVLNGTKYIYQNSSSIMHPIENLITRVRYTFIANVSKRESEIKFCNHGDLPKLTCPYLTFDASLFKIFKGNDTIIFLPQDKPIEPNKYLKVSDNFIQVCNFFEQWSLQNKTTLVTFFVYSEVQTLLSIVGSAISMVASAITLVTLMVFPSLRNTTSRLIMNLVVALFTGQLLLILGGSTIHNESLCFAVAVVSHYVWLVVFASMNALAFDLNRSFGNSENLQSINSHSTRYTMMYIIYSWGTPLLVILPCVIIHYFKFATRLQIHYGSDGACWIGDGITNFVTFATPVAGFLLVNFLLFVQTVHGIWSTKRSTSRVYNYDGPVVKRIIKELIIYIKVRHYYLLEYRLHVLSLYISLNFANHRSFDNFSVTVNITLSSEKFLL